MEGAASIRILEDHCPSPVRLSHAFGDTPPGLEREQIFRDSAKGKTERRGTISNLDNLKS